MDKTAVFNKVYDEYVSKLYAYFTVCFDSFTAEDLTQQTFMKVWKYLNKYDDFEPNVWQAWIFRIAVNIKNDFLRERKKYNISSNNSHIYEYFEPELTGSEYSHSGVSVPYAEVDLLSSSVLTSVSIEKAFSYLPKEQQELLTLKNFGFTLKEIAFQYNLTESQIRTKISNAKKLFSKYLSDCGVDDFE